MSERLVATMYAYEPELQVNGSVRAGQVEEKDGAGARGSDERGRLALLAQLRRAGDVLAEDPDAAALLLAEMAQRIAGEWFARRGLMAPDAGELLVALEREAPLLALRVRLALRAPDAERRLAHCWELLRWVE